MTLPLADITQVALEAEPGSDKAYSVDGSGEVYRVRVVLVAEIAPPFTATGGVAPIVQAFDITLTRIVNGAVLRDPAGRVVIAAHSRLTVDEQTRSRQGFTMPGTIMQTIRNLVHQAEARRLVDDEAAAYLASEWAVQPLPLI